MRKMLAGIVVAGLLLCGCSDSRDKLLQELMNPSPVKRAGALRVLAPSGDEEAYLLVSQAIEDPSAVVRIAAVRALASFKGRDTTAALIRATRDADPEVREAAVVGLAARKGEPVQRALVHMLLRAESSPVVREQIYLALEKSGLSGQGLAEEMASRQMEMIRQEWQNSRGSRRAQLVRLAGRSVHPEAVRVVLEGLADKNVDVVLAALSVLDGRGEKEAVRQLLLLASDQSVRIRQRAAQALRHYGQDGVAVLGGMLRDLNPEVRLEALLQLGKMEQDLDSEMLCPLLADKEQVVLQEAARLIRSKGIRCDLSVLAELLENPEDERYTAARRALSVLGGEQALKMLFEKVNKQPAPDRPFLAAAMAIAGDRSAKTRTLLESELQHLLSQVRTCGQGWVTGKLPPRQKPREEQADQTRLSEEELKKLYEKHGLPPASKDAPRGISDILAKYEEPPGPAPAPELFAAVTTRDVELFGELLQGLAAIDLASAAAVAVEALRFRHPELAGKAARLAREKKMTVDLDDELIGQLGGLLSQASDEDAGAIAGLLGTTGKPKAVEVLGSALSGMSWEKREHAIEALGELGRKEAIPPLLAMLEGYSAASAARALGAIGDPSAVEPLREALKRTGPSAEMDICMALSRLGSGDVVPMVTERLSDPDPEVRRAAVRILGRLGGAEAKQALEAVRFDLDRLVRAEAGNYLKESLEKE
jgi:HEAT repeat protein